MSADNPQRVLLQYQMPDGSSGSVQLDASVSEQHTQTSTVTEHQVETGFAATDHIRPLPPRVSLSAVISNTPTYIPATQMRGITGKATGLSAQVQTADGRTSTVNWQSLAFSDEFDRVRDAHGELVAAVVGGALFSITTTLISYENMAATNLSVPRSAASANAITLQIEFTQLRIVETQTVAALPSQKQRATKRGTKPTRDATDKEAAPADNRTAAAKLLDAL